MMEIIEQTDRALKIIDRNRQCLWGLLFAVPFLVIGLGVGAAAIKVTTLACQLTPDDSIECTRKVSGILGTETDQISGLQQAKTVKTSGTGIVLLTKNGRVELAPYRTLVTDSHFKNTERLNAFIKNPLGVTVEIIQDDRWINALWCGSFALVGLVISLFALAIPKQVICNCDRTLDRLTLTKQYWLYGKRETVLPLSTIERCQLRKLAFNINNRPLYTIDLLPMSGQKVSLSVPSMNLAAYQQMINATNNFIKLSEK